MPDGKQEQLISKQCINRTLIGVPPMAPEEYRLPSHFPTSYNGEMFKCEDERYNLDLNIMKYKATLKYLEGAHELTDEVGKGEKTT